MHAQVQAGGLGEQLGRGPCYVTHVRVRSAVPQPNEGPHPGAKVVPRYPTLVTCEAASCRVSRWTTLS